MTKKTYILFSLLSIVLVIYPGCKDVEDDFFDLAGTTRAPFITFDQIPDFRVDIFDPQTAAWEVLINDTGNAAENFELILSYTNEDDEVVIAENFKVIEDFPYELRISLVEIAEALNLDPSDIEPGTLFDFSSRATGKDGTVFSSGVWDFEDDNLVFEENDEGEIIRIYDPGTARQGGDLDNELDFLTNKGYKNAMSFRLITFIPPPPIYRFTSFEEVPVPSNDTYCKREGEDDAEDLQNNEGEPYVDWTATGDGPEIEIGFNSEFSSNEQGGFTCEHLGVLGLDVDDSGQNGWSNGEKGYYSEDIDGILKLTFDRVEIPAEHNQTGIRIDAFLRDTSYEKKDFLHIYVEVEKTDGSIETIDLIDADPDLMESLSDEVIWHTFDSGLMADVSAYTAVVEFSSSASSEKLYLDYLLIYLPRPTE